MSAFDPRLSAISLDDLREEVRLREAAAQRLVEGGRLPDLSMRPDYDGPPLAMRESDPNDGVF